jgi:hypothetical protein
MLLEVRVSRNGGDGARIKLANDLTNGERVAYHSMLPLEINMVNNSAVRDKAAAFF